jgi:hypothetical protein
MNRYGHLIVAFIVAVLFIAAMKHFYNWYAFSIVEVALMVAIVLVYSLLPDLDSTSATITWVFIGIGIVGLGASLIYLNAFGIICFYALLALTFVLSVFMKHRGFLHSIIFGILISLPLFVIASYPEVILAFVCFYSHLISDGKILKVI